MQYLDKNIPVENEKNVFENVSILTKTNTISPTMKKKLKN